MAANAHDNRPLFTVYARVAGAVVGFTARGTYADAVAFMRGTGTYRRHGATAVTVAEADAAATTRGAYAAYAGDDADVDTVTGAPAIAVEDAARYIVTTDHPTAGTWRTAGTRADAIALAHQLHGIRAANGATAGAVLVRDTAHGHGGAFIFRIAADGIGRTL